MRRLWIALLCLFGCGPSVTSVSYVAQGATCTAVGARTGPIWEPKQYVTICNAAGQIAYLPLGGSTNVIEQLAGPLGSIAQKFTFAVAP